MSSLQIGYYAKLIKRGNMLINEVPPDIRESVLEFMKTGKTPEVPVAPSVQEPTPVPKNERLGALNLPEMSVCAIPVQELKDGIPVHYEGKNAVIFDKVDVKPTNVRYEVTLVENTANYFNHLPNVKVNTTTEGFDLVIHGKSAENADHRGKKILRVDLMVLSDNYHDMRLTLYFAGI